MKRDEIFLDTGIDKELDLDNITNDIKHYIAIVYGNEKEMDRLLSFKVGKVCKNQLMDIVQTIIVNSAIAGARKQKEMDYKTILELNSQVQYKKKRA
ncbi:MAG: hypothetical protein RR623_09020 [Bacilli bacterium]